LWNLETGEGTTLHGHLNEVFAIAFSPDGRTVATGTKIDGAVALWSALPQARKKTSELLHGGSRDHILTVPILAPDGTALLERYEDNRTLGVWDTLELKETSRFSLEYGPATRFAISPSARLLAVGDTGGVIKLLDARTRQEIAQFTTSTMAIQRLEFSRDGRRLAARTADHKIRAWDIETRHLLAEIDGHASSIVPTHSSVFTFSPDGMALGVGYDDSSAEIIDLVTGRRLALLRGHKATVSGVVLLPDGKTVATASYDQAVKLWDLGTQRELATLRGEWLACFALAAPPDGRRLASGGGESTIRVWDTQTRQLVAMIKGTPGDEVVHLAFSPDGNTLIAVTRHTVRVWRAPTMAEIDRTEKPDANDNK
ncbi:MAG: WD40 repeat domain-containing protein, partial [Verrucomicrobiales bacterium]|nr:WD40 repeat domain-containing protein [Verrucomicrobiales bacterium]